MGDLQIAYFFAGIRPVRQIAIAGIIVSAPENEG
jgi:hypothetical protein